MLRPMTLWRHSVCVSLGLALVATVLAACALGSPADPEWGLESSGDGDPSAAAICPQVTPAHCPSPEPSWSGQISGIVGSVCGQCHADGGVEQSQFDFSTYQDVFRQRGTIFDQVASCAMPPSDGGVAFSNDDRAALLGWLVCSAPNN